MKTTTALTHQQQIVPKSNIIILCGLLCRPCKNYFCASVAVVTCPFIRLGVINVFAGGFKYELQSPYFTIKLQQVQRDMTLQLRRSQTVNYMKTIFISFKSAVVLSQQHRASHTVAYITSRRQMIWDFITQPLCVLTNLLNIKGPFFPSIEGAFSLVPYKTSLLHYYCYNNLCLLALWFHQSHWCECVCMYV